jgi:hypothetical protein
MHPRLLCFVEPSFYVVFDRSRRRRGMLGKKTEFYG